MFEYNITYREKDGGWQYIISFKDQNGKWKQRSKQGFSRKSIAKKAAEKRADELKEQFALNLNTEYEGITFGEFSKMFLEHIALYKEGNTAISYRTPIRKFSNLNNSKLSEITSLHIQRCIDDMVKEGLKPSTIREYKTKISAVFNNAIAPHGIIATNPVVAKLMIPKDKKNKKVKALTRAELNALLEKMYPEKDYIICLLASFCGLRLGEILGLQEHDINFKRRELCVNKQYKMLQNGKYGMGTVKSTNSNRTVPIPQKAAKPLKLYLGSNIKNIDRRIFSDNPGVAGQRLSKKMKTLGFDNSIHDLRHTYVTMLIANGVDVKTIAELIGDTVEMVIRTYSHFTKDMAAAVAKKVDQIFL
jgi:integrase